MHRSALIAMAVGFVALAGCTTTTTSSTPQSAPVQSGAQLSVSQATARLAPVKSRVEPVAEKECRERTKGLNCDFLIQVDKRADAPANAYQSLSDTGRPMITFTAALISDARNTDELAFVMGHEAAHHMMGHLGRQQSDAMTGAVLADLVPVSRRDVRRNRDTRPASGAAWLRAAGQRWGFRL